MNEPYDRLVEAVPDGRLQLEYGDEGWVASVWQEGVRRPAASGQGDTLEEALRALAVELRLTDWTP